LRSISGRDGPVSAPDRSLITPASEQVNCLSDDFARALGDECLEIPAITNVDTSPKALFDRQREVIDEFRSKTVPLLHCGRDVADHSSDSR
jgi:hypothetical protein